MTLHAVTLAIPLGSFTAISDGEAVVAAGFTADPEALRPRLADPTAEIRVHANLGQISAAVGAYFDGGDVTAIEAIPVDAGGSPAMRRLWDGIRRIPAGEVRSYAELGGSPRRARAAGTACARNPVPLIVPCHRVIRSDGGLGGFGWGLPVKRWLLDHEAATAGARQPALAIVAAG
jgi:methylated-DNA-[protein]-cysteine S-methyltransferase